MQTDQFFPSLGNGRMKVLMIGNGLDVKCQDKIYKKIYNLYINMQYNIL